MRIDTEDDSCYIWFRDELSLTDLTILNNLISDHLGLDSDEVVPKVQIMEENIGTGGHFLTKSIAITASANSSFSIDVHWPFPISALAMKLTTEGPDSQDSIDMSIGENTAIGALVVDSGNNPPLWSTGTYSKGDKVKYAVNEFYGERVYTCILNTTSDQDPSDKIYWRHGYELRVSSSVIKNCRIGFYIALSDGSAAEDLGRIVYKTESSIFLENAPTINFLSESPTQVKQTVYVLKDQYTGNGKIFSIGESKIGGSYVPSNIPVKIKYNNNSSSEKKLLGFVEYLY